LNGTATSLLNPAPRGIPSLISGGDVRKFEPKTWLKFKDVDKSIRELRAMFKQHPQWFEVPKPKSDKGQNAVDYSVE
jgi:hypothetical protein